VASCGVAFAKNYPFAGSDGGGERAAVIYSLIGTAKLNGIDPEFYLRDVLSSIAGPSDPSQHSNCCRENGDSRIRLHGKDYFLSISSRLSLT
jgi:hypothetical protein